MAKPKNYYIRYKRAELESYVKHPESCVKKIHKVEKLTFGSNVVNNFKESILRILSRKIGKYDRSMEGVVLDFRNTKILNVQTGVHYDSPYSVINIETNFYIFQPRKDAIVDGIVKHINPQKMETIISVVIYRVFNVKVTFRGCIKQCDVHHNKEIKIRIKGFHFDNEIPYIEGEMIGTTISSNTRKTFDDVLDSGISESKDNTDDDEDIGYSTSQLLKIKQERESSTEQSTPTSSNKKQRKRKIVEDTNDSFKEPPVKKIKEEPISDEELLATNNNVTVKAENSDNSEAEYISKKKKKKDKSSTKDHKESTEVTTKTKKNKKKKSADDDFESSLKMILNSSIKQEKD